MLTWSRAGGVAPPFRSGGGECWDIEPLLVSQQNGVLEDGLQSPSNSPLLTILPSITVRINLKIES